MRKILGKMGYITFNNEVNWQEVRLDAMVVTAIVLFGSALAVAN